MKSFYALTPEDLGELYVQACSGYLPDTAQVLVGDVKRWLQAGGLNHRLNEAATIASAVLNIATAAQPEPQPVATPEQAAWANDIMQGTTATDLPQGGELYAFLTGR
jgi:hypothetical protein